MASEYRPASKAAIAAVRRRMRSLMWDRSCEMFSDSERAVGLRGGVEGGVVAPPEEISDVVIVVGREKLSSDQQMLSRRNAAEARRLPVWSRTMASSIRPRLQHACPRTKYLKSKIEFQFYCLIESKQTKLMLKNHLI